MMFFRPSIDNTTSHLFYIYPVLGSETLLTRTFFEYGDQLCTLYLF